MRTRDYKVAVRGELADRLLQATPETAWLNKDRVSQVVFVVTVPYPEVAPREMTTEQFTAYQGTDAYLMDVMVEDEGTFPDLVAAKAVGWTVFP